MAEYRDTDRRGTGQLPRQGHAAHRDEGIGSQDQYRDQGAYRSQDAYNGQDASRSQPTYQASLDDGLFERQARRTSGNTGSAQQPQRRTSQQPQQARRASGSYAPGATRPSSTSRASNAERSSNAGHYPNVARARSSSANGAEPRALAQQPAHQARQQAGSHAGGHEKSNSSTGLGLYASTPIGMAILIVALAGVFLSIALGVSLARSNSTRAELETKVQTLQSDVAFLQSKNQQLESSTTDAGTAATTTEGAVATATTATAAASTTTASGGNSGSAGGVDDPWVASGKFTTGNAELDNDVKSFCDSLSDPSLSAEDNAYNVYLRVSWYDYVERDNNQSPSGPDWDITYALQLYNEGGGNCYEFVAFCGFCLQYFGYDAHGEPCLIERGENNVGNHGLVIVNGGEYVCNLSLSSKGWMLPGDTYSYTIQDVGQNA